MGFGFGSLYDTYLLTLKNGTLMSVLEMYFSQVRMKSRQWVAHRGLVRGLAEAQQTAPRRWAVERS